MGLVYHCQDVVYPDSAWRAVRKTKSFGGLVRSRLRWSSLMREVSPAFNGALFGEKVKLLYASTPIGNSSLPNNNHQTTTGLGCPLPRRLSTL